MQVASVVLFVLGGALEVCGILLVVGELRADRERALEVAAISIPHASHDPLEGWPESPSWTIQGAIDKDRRLQPQGRVPRAGEKLRRS